MRRNIYTEALMLHVRLQVSNIRCAIVPISNDRICRISIVLFTFRLICQLEVLECLRIIISIVGVQSPPLPKKLNEAFAQTIEQ